MGNFHFLCREKDMIINEIFTSIDGEVNKWGQGALTTFVRTQGCNLRCSYCDTPKAIARDEDEFWYTKAIYEIYDEIKKGGCKKVTITGGEPLLQKDIFDLISYLQFQGYNISIETNGTIPIPKALINRENICWVVDYKWDYKEQMRVTFEALSKNDWIKFVVSSNNVYQIFDKIRDMRKEGVYARIAVSDSIANHKWLVNLLIQERMFGVSLNVQLHKLINVA